MRVKPKNLFYEFLPGKKDKKKLMAAQGAAVGNGPVDPRIKNMVKTLPDNYFDIFGTQPEAQPPGLAPIPAQGPQPITAPPPAPLPQDSGVYNPGVHSEMHHQGMNWGNAALETMLGVDAILPRQKIHNQKVIRPERGVEGYQPYPYGTGSQALADGGGVQPGPRKPIYTNDPNDPRIKRYNDSLNIYSSAEREKSKLPKEGWKRKGNLSLEEERKSVAGNLEPKGVTPNSWDLFTRKNTHGVDDLTYIGNYNKPVQPYKYKTDNENDPISVSDKNDPRLKKYTDSLNAYNFTRKIFNGDVTGSPTTPFDPNTMEARKWAGSGEARSILPKGTNLEPKYEVRGGNDNNFHDYFPVYEKPKQPYAYQKPEKELKRSNVRGRAYIETDYNGIPNPSLSSDVSAGGKTPFSFTGRDQQGQQTTRYFSDKDTWQAASDMLGYSHRELSNQDREGHATGIGNQFDDGGWMMDTMREGPIVIPEGVADNSLARNGFQIPIAKTLQYENLPAAASGYQIKNDVVHMEELPTQRQMENRMEKAKDGKWIQKAVNPKHKGYCTPMTKSTCTPRRKALARTFKKHHGFHKKEDGGVLEALLAYGGIIPDNMSNFSPHQYEYGGTARGGSDTPDMLENIFFHPSSQDMAGYAMGGSMGGGMGHGGGHMGGHSMLGLYGVGDDSSPYPKKRKKGHKTYEGGGTEGPGDRYKPPVPTYNFEGLGHTPTAQDSVEYRNNFDLMRMGTPLGYSNMIYNRDTMLPGLNMHYTRTGDPNDQERMGSTRAMLNAYNDALQPGTMMLNLPKDIKKKGKMGSTLRGGSDTPDMLENIFFHPSSADMAGYYNGGPVRGGSDTKDMLENIFFHPSSADMKGWDKAKQGKTLSKSKAREMLHDKSAHGHPLTDRQRRYFGAVASGYADMGLPVPGGGTPPVTPLTPSNDRENAQFVDDINYTLVSGNRPRGGYGGYSPDQKQLAMQAYIWRQQNQGKGRSNEDMIQGFYDRPTTTGNPVDELRSRSKIIGYGPVAMYKNTPNTDLQQRQGSTAGTTATNTRPAPTLHFDDGGVMYDDGGNIETMWGGNVEMKAYNPYDGGTMAFNGASHENGGIGMHYNGNPVEVEGGETASRDSQGNLNIYGNMYLPGTRTKFKSIAKEMAEKEKHYDGLRTRGAELVNNSNPADKFGKLAFNAGKAMMSGGTVGQKDLAEKKENLAHLQRAMLDTASEHGLDAQEMSKGNIKKAKKGGKAKGGAYIPFAEDGLTTDQQGGPNDPTRADRNKNPGNIKYGNWAKAHGAIGKDKDGFAIFQDRDSGELAMRSLLQSKSYNNMSVKDAIHKWTDGKPYRHDLGGLENKRVGNLSQEEFDSVIEGMKTGEGTRYGTSRAKIPVKPLPVPLGKPQIPYTPLKLPEIPLTTEQKKQIPPGIIPPPLGEIPTPGRPTLPTNAEPLQLEEVLPELYGAATNRVEPVPMQQYRPELYTPYQVSFQDRLNQNQSSFNALQRTLGSTNPNALGALAAQKYAADSGVKADEFRTNQAISNDITNRNIGLSNDAQLKNLAIADTQYDRQEGARAKTREYNQMILNSLSSKYAQNKLENNRLKAYENLYDYRFMPTDKGGLQATYMGPNAMFNFNQTGAARQNQQDVRTVSQYDRSGNLKGYRTYDESQLKEAREAIMLEEQRRKLPLLSVPPL